VPNSETGEKNPPQREITIAGNTVYGNNNAKTAAIDIAQVAIGTGILVAGGIDDVVVRNLVYGPRPHRYRRDPAPGEGDRPEEPQGHQLRRAWQPDRRHDVEQQQSRVTSRS